MKKFILVFSILFALTFVQVSANDQKISVQGTVNLLPDDPDPDPYPTPDYPEDPFPPKPKRS
jgi:hypothetical protein